MQYRHRLVLAGMILMLATGCSLASLVLESGLSDVYPALDAPASTLQAGQTQTEVAAQVTGSPETAIPEIDQLNETEVPCAYVWDTQPLIEETAQLQVAFRESGLSRAEVWAEAYGERCVNVDTKLTEGGFLILQTDVRVRMSVIDLEDEDALGRLLAQITGTISALPEDAFPGTQKGYVGVEFSGDEGLMNLWFPLSHAEQALDGGLRNAALLQALQ